MSDTGLSAPQPAFPFTRGGGASQPTLLEHAMNTEQLLSRLVGHVERSASHLGNISGNLEKLGTTDAPLNVKPDAAALDNELNPIRENISTAQASISRLDAGLQQTNQDVQAATNRTTVLETSVRSFHQHVEAELNPIRENISTAQVGISRLHVGLQDVQAATNRITVLETSVRSFHQHVEAELNSIKKRLEKLEDKSGNRGEHRSR